jgi:hypothetical protein
MCLTPPATSLGVALDNPTNAAFSRKSHAFSADARTPDFAVDLVRVANLLPRPALSARIEVQGDQD